MKLSIRILVLVIVFVAVAIANFSFVPSASNAAKRVQAIFMQQLDSLDKRMQGLESFAMRLKDKSGVQECQKAHLTARKAYKQIEYLVEYYNPLSAKQLNGGMVDEVEEDDPNQRVLKPQGLQVVEDLLWADSAWRNKQKLLQEIATIRGVLVRVKQLGIAIEFDDESVFEAINQEITRIYALGLAGFDSPAAATSLREALVAYKSVQDALLIYAEQAPKECKHQIADLNAAYSRVINAFSLENELASFNHAYFIQKMALPYSAAVLRFQEALKIPFNGLSTALKPNNSTAYTSSAWNAQYFSADKYSKPNAAQVNLGRMLFFDPVLSGNNKRACASCHQPSKAFTDSVPKSIAFNFEGTVSRNAPSVINSALQNNLFWDGRVAYYEDQITAVTQNEEEMHGDLAQVVNKLEKSADYVALFKAAYKGTTDTAISSLSLRKAIAAYERSLVAYNSRFDQYLNGNSLAMNAQEIAGFTLFMSKAQCGTCHFVPTFGGTVPPAFTKTEFEIIGVPATAENKELDKDQGKFLVTNKDLHKFAFKTPSLRNIALTGPYMHNGVYKTLDEVINFYNKGGGEGLGYEVPNQTLPTEPLKLKKREIRNLLAFMNALTDTVGMTAKPNRLPQFADEALNKRKIGGEY